MLQSQIEYHNSLRFFPTNTTVKLANGNTGNAQGIGIILSLFPNCSIIYPVRPCYYFKGHPSKHYHIRFPQILCWFKNVTYEPLEHCDFVDPQYCSWISPWQPQNNLDYIKIEIIKFKPQRNSNIVVPNVCDLSKQNLSQIIHQRFGHVSISRLKRMSIKWLMVGLPTNLP